MFAMSAALAGVTTDQADYAPGSTVTITGDEMWPGETVLVEVFFPDGSLAHANMVDADADGAFVDTMELPGLDAPVYGTYTVVATGLWSENVFTTTFTDAHSVSPTSLTFNATAGGSNPASQTFTFFGPATCQGGTVFDDQTWISVSPTSYADFTTASSVVITVSIDITGLSAGTHTGKVTVDDSSTNPACADPRAVDITLNLASADSAPPVVNVSFPGPDGDNGWFKTGPVIGSVTATDSSNVSVITCTGATLGTITGLGTTSASAPLTVSGEGTHNVNCTATDGQGNSGAASGSNNTATLKIDTVDPVVGLSFGGPDGDNGWFKTNPVSGSVSATDATSGLASVTCSNAGLSNLTDLTGFPTSATGDLSVTDEGTNNVSCDATDAAGNSFSDSATIKIDSVKPSIDVIFGAPDGLNGWFVTSPVSGSVSASDATSGLALVTCSANAGLTNLTGVPGNSATGDLSVSSDGENTVSCTATDDAGNSESDSETVKIDTIAPEATITGGGVVYSDSTNGTVSFTCNMTDASPGSGVNGTATVVEVDGSPATATCDGAAVNTAPVTGLGAHTVTVEGADNAGNTSNTADATYYLRQAILLQPLYLSMLNEFRPPQTLPTKVQIKIGAGDTTTAPCDPGFTCDSALTLAVKQVSCDANALPYDDVVVEDSGSSNSNTNGFRLTDFNSNGVNDGQIYNLSTKSGYSKGKCYKFSVMDGYNLVLAFFGKAIK
jgi:hypothetical protein